MRSLVVPTFGALFAVALGTSAIAEDETGDWVRSQPVDATYSIETPCSAERVALLSQEPLNINGRAADTDTNVTCIDGLTAYSSGVLSVPASALGELKMFDLVMQGLKGRDTSNLELNETELSGRRAITSREARGGAVAQTTVVELSNSKLLMVVSGGETEDIAETGLMIDKHIASLKVAEQ